jgi:hypothetical protein
MAALLVGNSAYPASNSLNNPANDARDMAARLRAYGFTTLLSTDATGLAMDKQLKKFKTLLKSNDVALFFFAGHGIQIDGVNYLLAIDTDTSGELEAKHSSLPLDRVIEIMAKSNASTKIIILDACRNNPWKRAWARSAASRGLASVYAPKGTIIGFATSPGELAQDGSGKNGTYTSALLQHIDAPDCSIETMFKRVRNTVAADTRGKQTTWEHTSLSGEFYFNMSIGKLVQEYSETSLADSLFVVDEAKRSHQIVKGLKSYDWYKQNPALDLLDASSSSRMSKHSLFVVGRNIYQAACGNAHSAQGFITDFMSRTGGFDPEKRKAILDGMLFEIFFDSKGTLRDRIKGTYFDQVFDLQKYAELKESFDFIAQAVSATRGKFYVVPGKGHQLPLTVATKKVDDSQQIEAVYIDGKDVLRPEDDEWAAAKRMDRRISKDQLIKELSEQLVVPGPFLKVTFTPAGGAKADEFGFPWGWTVRKA